MGQVQRDIIILQALDDIPVQPAGIGHDLHAREDLCALERHPARHNQANVPAAENQNPPPDHVALHIHIALGRPRRKDACRACPGDGDGTACALPTAHRQHDAPRRKNLIAVCPAHGVHRAGRTVKREDHCVQPHLDPRTRQPLNKAAGVLRARELLLEIVQAKAVVDALIEDAAQLRVALQDQHPPGAVLMGAQSGRQSGGAAAYYDYIIHGLTHGGHLPVWSAR